VGVTDGYKNLRFLHFDQLLKNFFRFILWKSVCLCVAENAQIKKT